MTEDPQALSWEHMRDELGFTDADGDETMAGAWALVSHARAYRLAEVRRRQQATQTDIARAMGVTQARVSRIEKGELSRSEVDTLAAYVQALGGKLKIVADFGEESYVLG
jgi:predicted XRE-type DNA-binding protein